MQTKKKQQQKKKHLEQISPVETMFKVKNSFIWKFSILSLFLG